MKRAERASHVAHATRGVRASRGACAASGSSAALNFDVMEVEIRRAGGRWLQIGKGLHFFNCLN